MKKPAHQAAKLLSTGHTTNGLNTLLALAQSSHAMGTNRLSPLQAPQEIDQYKARDSCARI